MASSPHGDSMAAPKLWCKQRSKPSLEPLLSCLPVPGQWGRSVVLSVQAQGVLQLMGTEGLKVSFWSCPQH